MVGHDDARVQATTRRRARVRARREERTARQARTPAGRLQLYDVEQRHVRVRRRHRSDLRVRAVRDRDARRQSTRPVPRQHVAHQLRHRPHRRRHPRVRRRAGRAELLLHQRPRSRRRGLAIHVAHRADADAAAVGARVSPVPVQLLPGIDGPLRRREFSSASHPGRHDLARHPLSGWLQAVHVGRRAISQSRSARRRSRSTGISSRHDRRCASEKGSGIRAVRHRSGRRSLRQDTGRLDLRGARLARARRAKSRTERVPRFHAARHAHVVGIALCAAARRRRRRHLERHERAGGVRYADRHDAARRALRQRGDARLARGCAQRVRPAGVSFDLRRTAAPPPELASVRPDPRDLRGRSAVRGCVGGRQRQRVDAPARIDPVTARHGPLGPALRRRRHRRLRRSAERGALHALAAAGRVLPVHAHAHDVRHAGSGSMVVRNRSRGTEPPRDRAAVRAAALHL